MVSRTSLLRHVTKKFSGKNGTTVKEPSWMPSMPTKARVASVMSTVAVESVASAVMALRRPASASLMADERWMIHAASTCLSVE